MRAPFSFILSFWYYLLVSLTAFGLKLKILKKYEPKKQ
ncbi:hypothetical protein HMPREF9126_1583 [Parvimonas sp. oral taxon 110 str. F0139]|nr:hypothetical protein HMPREF9126_1583 [Parvimonas sp. oral taxon 110 str. F0139]